MNATLRRVFARAVAPIAAPACASPERQRLRAALAAQVKAKQEQIAAAAAVERARQLMRDADVAETAAHGAEAAAIASTEAWVAAGAKADTSPGDRSLLDKAAAAQRRAADAKLMAEGARIALPQIQAAAADARAELENCDDTIKRFVAQVLLAEAEPHFRALQRAHGEYMAALHEVQALYTVLSAGGPRGGPAHAFYQVRSTSGAALIAQRLLECEIHALDVTMLKPYTNAWVTRARALATDPDAAP